MADFVEKASCIESGTKDPRAARNIFKLFSVLLLKVQQQL